VVSSLEQAIEGEEEPGEDEDGRIDEHGEEERDEEPILCHVRAYKGIGLYQAQLQMRQHIRSHRNHDKQKREC